MIKNIMLVDDVDISNYLMKKLIRRIDDTITIHDFIDPQEALHQLPALQPDLIFLDINMPVINGWQFLSRMQQQSLPQRVIIVTSSTSQLDRAKADTYQNVTGFFQKPPSVEGLTAILQP